MAPAPGPWAALSAEPRDARPRGEAGRPPLGRPAWGWCPWPAGGDEERAATSWDPRILTLLDDAREWLDLEGDFELEGSMGANLGVLGEGCASMGVILVVEWKNEKNSGGEGLNEEEGDASRLKSTQIDLNAPEMNVYNDLNVARKDEGECLP